MEQQKVFKSTGIIFIVTLGEIMLLDLSSAELELRKKACDHEVVDIISNNNELKAMITSIDSKVYTWNYSESL